ncbi:hypothetical protein V8E52_004994 [Russula decolorans]
MPCPVGWFLLLFSHSCRGGGVSYPPLLAPLEAYRSCGCTHYTSPPWCKCPVVLHRKIIVWPGFFPKVLLACEKN